jgi:2-polyprenyl-6-methoxyphenol hydroxylase-like FAD-dependent oxidoreductase
MKAIIVGGGIGGLSAAIALRQNGCEVEVYERAPAIREVGAGISLWANAVKILDRLGVGAEIRARKEESGSGALRNKAGTVLSRMRFDELERICKAPMIFIHRAELIDVLKRAIPDEAVHLGAELQSFEAGANGVAVSFADGRSARGDILMAADGLRSRVRLKLFPNTPPRYAGYSSFRAICTYPHEKAGDAWGETWGRGVRFGLIPMSHNRIYWFLARNAAEGVALTPAQRKDIAVQAATGWHAPVPDVIGATAPDAIIQADIHDIDAPRTFHSGRVVLLGDAAHAMQPNLGQGACQAIEDAFVLAKCLKEKQEIAAAFAAYDKLRVEHTRAVIREAHKFGRVCQLSNPLACWLRDIAVRCTPAKMSLRPLIRFAECEW